MKLLFIYLVGGAIAALIVIVRGWIERKRDGEFMDDEIEEKTYSGNGNVGRILYNAFRSLHRQGAGGYGPWLSSCIERINKGYIVPNKVALQAVRRTIADLDGSRFNIACLLKAESELMEMGA